MSKLIPLTQGKFAIVDDEDFEFLSQWKWSYRKGYASRADYSEEKVNWNVQMHNTVMPPPAGMIVDHKNRNTLDYRRDNLRFLTDTQNRYNSLRKNKTSQFKGVYWSKDRNKWRSAIRKDGQRFNLGCFDSPVMAAQIYDVKAKELFGDAAYLNF